MRAPPRAVVIAVLVAEPANAPDDITRILRELERPLHRYLAAQVRSLPDAEDLAWDLVQETLIRVVRNLGRCHFETPARRAAWALRVAHSVLVEHFRRAASREPARSFMLRLDEPGDVPMLRVRGAEECESATRAAEEVMRSAVADAHASLPPETAELVRIRVTLDATWKEVGARMGTTESAAKRRYQRACNRLRTDILRRLQALSDAERQLVRARLRRLTSDNTT